MKVGTRPIKRWSQNFLIDRNVAKKIVESMDVRPEDSILEIGPGHGALTDLLVQKAPSCLVAIEIDPRMTNTLRDRYRSMVGVEIVEGDFLKSNLSLITRESVFRVVANLPYSITSPILFKMLEFRTRFRDATVMVQKEVADRLVSSPGTKVYGIPSVLFQAYSRIEALFNVSRGSFFPIPGVDSKVLRIVFDQKSGNSILNETHFIAMVRAVFGQRRKKMRNTLRSWLGIDVNGTVSFDLNRRPEDLEVSEFIRLSNELVRSGFGKFE